MTAKLNDLKQLYELEKDYIIKPSKLKEVTIYPKPIERQNDSHCLWVYSDQTLGALKSHFSSNAINVKGTSLLLERVIKFWK